MEVHHDSHEVPKRTARLARRRRRWVPLGLFLLSMPALLAPNHPIAVYAYLFDSYLIPEWSDNSHDPEQEAELSRFLVSPVELARYRVALREDLNDRESGHFFAIARNEEGVLEHVPVRTWNSLLTSIAPDGMDKWLDLKEFPHLGDFVGMWLANKDVVAMGHYHPFGGGPSDGDRRAMAFSRHTEVVVSNGVVPLVYAHGEVVSYGAGFGVSRDVLRSLRVLDRYLGMNPDASSTYDFTSGPTDELMTILGYLNNVRGVDTRSKVEVASELAILCAEFRFDYGESFNEGLVPFGEEKDTDRYVMLQNLMAVELWSIFVGDGSPRRPDGQPIIQAKSQATPGALPIAAPVVGSMRVDALE